MCLTCMSLRSWLQSRPAFLKLGSTSWTDFTPYNIKLSFLLFLPVLSTIATTSIKIIFTAIGVTGWGEGRGDASQIIFFFLWVVEWKIETLEWECRKECLYTRDWLKTVFLLVQTWLCKLKFQMPVVDFAPPPFPPTALLAKLSVWFCNNCLHLFIEVFCCFSLFLFVNSPYLKFGIKFFLRYSPV